MRTIRIPIFIALAVLLVACSSPPEPTLYLMRGERMEGGGAPAARPEGTPRVGFGRIVVAPYLLSSRGLVLETAPGEVRPAQLHQWAEPIDESLRWFLRGELERLLGYPVSTGVDARKLDYTISVQISQLHGTLNGEALLEALFVIRRPLEEPEVAVAHRFASSRPLDEGDYAALARAEQELVADLAAAIAKGLEAQGTP